MVERIDLPLSEGDAIHTIPAACRRANMSERIFRRACDAGEIPTYQVGSRWKRVIWSEVLAWLRTKRVRPSDQVGERVAAVLERENRRERSSE